MDSNTLFSERQKFTQWWLWLILLGVNGMLLYGVYQQLILGIPFGNHPMPDAGLFVPVGLILFITGLFYISRLETQIKQDGIYVRFIPYFFRYRKYAWEQIEQVYVRQYRPIAEYGGWGVRFGFAGRGKAYNVTGDQGLQLVFTDGKKLLIGTLKPNEIRTALVVLGKDKT